MPCPYIAKDTRSSMIRFSLRPPIPALVLLLLGQTALPSQASGIGPAVGSRIPAFETIDHQGKTQDFESLRGPRGLLLVFQRSADWCIYCKDQLVQLERQRRNFQQEGINIAAVSFDPPDVLRHFAERTNIQYPLLADPDSKMIRAFQLLNEAVPTDHRFYGVAQACRLLIDDQGRITKKFLEEDTAERVTAGNILVRELQGESGAPRVEKGTKHLRLSTWTSDEIVRAENRVTLVVDVHLNPKMHVYAPGVVGYLPIEWVMADAAGLEHFPVAYPDSELLHLPAIQEIVPVYHGSFRLMADVLLGKEDVLEVRTNERGELLIEGSFRYQACDDKLCYLPEEVPLEWTFPLEPHDRTRVPEEPRSGARR